ncbi:diacylglycerol acyltransferase-domain-containing protein [Xylaria longipes]|nr:diacylglycerol acyltransferase-domain-containing protein [Xylaria longipes]
MAEDISTAEPKQPRTVGTSPRYFYLVSRKNSQSSVPGPETGNTSEREARRGKDTIKSHRRDPSNTSQESYDTHIPGTPLVTNKEDRLLDFSGPESPSRKPKTVTLATSTNLSLARPPSQVPRGLGAKSNSPRQLLRRKPSLKELTGSKMADQADNMLIAMSLTSKMLGNQSPNSPLESETVYSREASSVTLDETSTRYSENGDSVEDRSIPKANGLSESGHKGLCDGQVQNDVTYASALKPSLHDDDNNKDHDDDESYPDLDEMGVEEIYRPPPRSPNGGIRWAPWNVPFKRRGQTLVVLVHSLSIVATVSLFFAFCANPFAWPLLLIYLLHVLSSKAATDGSLKYRSEWFRKSHIWHFFADYYPAKLHKTHDLPATRKYIFGYHPHGIISHGAWAAFATEALGFSQKFPGITNSLLTLDSNFRIPFYREYILSMGVRSVSKESIVNILNKGGPNGEGMGRGVTVVVGGARESLEAQPGMMRLILKERKGFIKLAVRCGADLVPVLAFGENNLYDQLQPQEHPFMHRIQMFLLKVWKFTLPFLHGRGVFNYDVGLMPYRRPLNIVVGAPIKVRQSSSVDLEEINRLHGLYVAELEKLWDRYKDEFAPDRKEEMQILP